jgi:predicted transcriptional regulator
MVRLALLGCTFALTMARGAAGAEAPAPGKKPAPPKKLPYTLVPSKVGKKLPPFTVETGDGKSLASKGLAGRVAVITYETRTVVEVNRPSKIALGEVLAKRFVPGSWQLVAIVDASSANFFTRRVWRRKLVENSKKERIDIYGDWDGKTASSLGVKRGASNLVIVDAAGAIRYFAHGRFDAAEIRRQRALLESLAPKPRKPVAAPARAEPAK